MKPPSKSFGRFKKHDIKVITQFLEERFPAGHFTPADIVDAASPRRSPIHKYFEWDDTAAAKQWRIQQARQIVNAVVVQIHGIESPGYVSVRINQKRSYIQTEEARNIPDIWEQVLARALQEAESWANRYNKFKQLSPIIKIINKVKKEIKV